jgi:hypothetical protein
MKGLVGVSQNLNEIIFDELPIVTVEKYGETIRARGFIKP